VSKRPFVAIQHGFFVVLSLVMLLDCRLYCYALANFFSFLPLCFTIVELVAIQKLRLRFF